ncbi:DUF4738 domain-containing protein [Prevotella nigrescens]|uniref:DUF4738 domain-containing protein n=1 Tax=Prevotella nigrescens TaxID=28133 RepID=UPI003612A311
MKQNSFCLIFLCLLLAGCFGNSKQDEPVVEDTKAKELFQGLWVSDDNGEPVLLAKGDSVFYPDSGSIPVRFWIYKDSFYLKGQSRNLYKIEKQSENSFTFINDNGEEVRLVKSRDKDLRASFGYHVYAMNTFLHAETDTVVRTDLGYFNIKISVATTSDKIIKSTYNENGIEVDNAYLDNAASLVISNQKKTVYSHEFRKQEFASLIDKAFLEKSILRRFEFNHANAKALYFDAVIGIPDASTSYVIAVKITADGKLAMKMR